MSDDIDPINLLLLGNTGAGKSSTGNTILSAEVDKIRVFFSNDDSFGDSRTTEPKIVDETVLGRNLNVIDTVGFLNKDDINMAEQFQGVFNGCGIDAFLMVIKCDTKAHEISPEDLKSLNYVVELLGENFWNYCIFVVTYGNTYDQFVKESSYEVRATFEKEILTKRLASFNKRLLGPWVAKAKGGAVLLENTEKDPATRKEWVKNLLEKVEFLREKNNGNKFHTTISVPEPKPEPKPQPKPKPEPKQQPKQQTKPPSNRGKCQIQ